MLEKFLDALAEIASFFVSTERRKTATPNEFIRQEENGKRDEDECPYLWL